MTARLRYLLRLYADDKATQPEIIEMLDLLREEGGNDALEALMKDLAEEDRPAGPPVDWERVWARIHKEMPLPLWSRGWFRVAVAAVILVALGAGTFHWWGGKHQSMAPPVAVKDIAPGGNKAILTLGNGQRIILDSASNGTLTRQGGAAVMKLADGRLAYRRQGNGDAVVYNTMSTPKGGQYRLALPDGSEVWLNAASSIRFPTAFTGSDRTVEITGEAYFEIAKQPGKPFRVRSGDMTVNVLGTHFDVKAYSDEAAMNTTLLQGKVRIERGGGSAELTPGERAVLDKGIRVEHNVDLDAAVAWKEGYFDFKDTELKDIMRQVMRWYDVDVVYQGTIPDRYFTADISRGKSLGALLKILALGNVHFKLDGKKLVVMP